MTQRIALRILLTTLLLVTLQACARGVRVASIPIQAQVEATLAQEPSIAIPSAGGSVEVVVETSAGGLAMRNGDDVPEGADWVDAQAPRVPEGATAEEAAAILDPWLEGLRRDHRTTTVVFFSDYSEALASALRHHLRPHFAAANVRVGVAPEARGEASTVVASRLQVRDDGIKRVELQLVNADGGIAAGEGERRPRRHLGWMIPLSMVSFPLGLWVVQAVQPRINRSAFRQAVVEAIDRAARDYADRLADSCRTPGAPAYCGPRTWSVAGRRPSGG